jgi:hypothetical protein
VGRIPDLKEIPMNPSVEALENQYFLLRSSLGTLIAQGATAQQVEELRAQIARSRNNYWTAINNKLDEQDPEVKSLVSQLNTEQLSLNATIDHLGNVAKILDAITKAVDIGSQIVSKVVAL